MPGVCQASQGVRDSLRTHPGEKGDDTIDILVFEDDAARANRIVEKFKLTVVDTASIKEDIEKSREQRGSEPAAPEQAMPEKARTTSFWMS